MTTAHLARVELPDFGMPDAAPEIPAAVYEARLGRLRDRSAEHGYDGLIVYADREHSANLAYLTGFDPRFEEALLAVGPSGQPAVLVGNECWGLAGAAPSPCGATCSRTSACRVSRGIVPDCWPTSSPTRVWEPAAGSG